MGKGAWKIKTFPFFGKVKIWMYHDADMGKCVFEDGFVTPNMPKLHYAIQFDAVHFKIFDRLNPRMVRFKKMYVFEKRDGGTPVHPREMMKIANQYGLNHVKFYGVYDVDANTIIELMEKAEKKNREAGEIVTEGYVAHCFLKGDYRMFKIKPYTVMQNDVQRAKRKIPLDVVKREINKVLLEVDVEAIAKNPVEHLRTVFDYLSEDYSLTHQIKKNVMYVFTKIIGEEILRLYPDITPEQAGRRGFHKMIIGAIIKLKGGSAL